ncbi:hypothetical protein [Dyadobacter sp. OTU695]
MKSVNLVVLELVRPTKSEKEESNGDIMLHPLHIGSNHVKDDFSSGFNG